MGGTACKAKIILNGGTIQSELAKLCYQIEETPADDIPYDTGIEMVKLLNAAENEVFAVERLYLETTGFKGPWPASLDNPEVLKLLGRKN